MNALSVEAFERRAKEAEDRLGRIEKKLASRSGGGVSSENLCDILAVLYDVRSTLGREKVKSQNSEAKQASLENQVSKVSRARGIRAEGLKCGRTHGHARPPAPAGIASSRRRTRSSGTRSCT